MKEIINSIVVDDEPIAREILSNHLKKIDAIQLIGTCKNAIEAFNLINSKKVDLVFLDINMPEISGLSFARSINKNIRIIFTTAYREYAVDGFDLKAVDYLLKPISFERLLQAIHKYKNEQMPVHPTKDQHISMEKSDFIFVRSDRKMIKIDFEEVLYIESLADYVKICLTDKTIVTRETISNLEVKLPQNDFLRVHRSFIIAINKIESFTHEFIEIGKKAIPISRSYKNDVISRLENV